MTSAARILTFHSTSSSTDPLLNAPPPPPEWWELSVKTDGALIMDRDHASLRVPWGRYHLLEWTFAGLKDTFLADAIILPAYPFDVLQSTFFSVLVYFLLR